MIKIGYYSINDIKTIIKPNKYSKNDIIKTERFGNMKIIQHHKVDDVINLFNNETIKSFFSRFEKNTNAYLALIYDRNQTGVCIIHESEIIND